jgi:hypothetical protein
VINPQSSSIPMAERPGLQADSDIALFADPPWNSIAARCLGDWAWTFEDRITLAVIDTSWNQKKVNTLHSVHFRLENAKGNEEQSQNFY